MSKKREKTLNAESGLEEKDSVYDFLYQDARRIGSFLSQFNVYGHLQSQINTSSILESSGSSYNVGGGLGVSGIANLKADGTEHEDKSGSQTAAKTYDPLWQNCLALLDYLTDREFICRDLSAARIGQFVLACGKLSMFDMAVMKAIMLTDRCTSILSKSMFDDDKNTRNSNSEKREKAQAVQAVINQLPFGLQMYLESGGCRIWSSLRATNLELNMDDLMLKHGASIEGEWSMLGILDALPDAEGSMASIPSIFNNDDEMAKHIAELITKMRPKIGRPYGSYGMTPILIFREVSRSDSGMG